MFTYILCPICNCSQTAEVRNPLGWQCIKCEHMIYDDEWKVVPVPQSLQTVILSPGEGSPSSSGGKTAQAIKTPGLNAVQLTTDNSKLKTS